MKSTLYKLNDKHSFPMLAESVHSKKIVLFISENTGIIIKPGIYLVGPGNETIGAFSKHWSSVFNREQWEILSSGSSVTLTQE